MDEIKIDDVVRFNSNATSLAAKFCHEHDLAGRIVGIEQSRYVVDAGIGYNIYVPRVELEICQSCVIEPVPDFILKLVPQNDDYQN